MIAQTMAAGVRMTACRVRYEGSRITDTDVFRRKMKERQACDAYVFEVAQSEGRATYDVLLNFGKRRVIRNLQALLVMDDDTGRISLTSQPGNGHGAQHFMNLELGLMGLEHSSPSSRLSKPP